MHEILHTSGLWAINGVLVCFAVCLIRDLAMTFSPNIKQARIFEGSIWIKVGLMGLIIGGILGAFRGLIG